MELYRLPRFYFDRVSAVSTTLLLLSNASSEGVAAGHSAAPRRLQETGVSTR
jgi:hypothetical protein